MQITNLLVMSAAGAGMLLLSAGVVLAQDAVGQPAETTSQAPLFPAANAPTTPQGGTLSVTKTEHINDGNGTVKDSRSTVYRDPTGVAADSQTVTKRTIVPAAPPPPPQVTTTTSTTTESTTGPQ